MPGAPHNQLLIVEFTRAVRGGTCTLRDLCAVMFRPGLSFAEINAIHVPDAFNLTVLCPGHHMPINVLGQDGQPSIGFGGHLWFIHCQVRQPIG